MSTFSYNNLKPGVEFTKDGEPYKVLEYEFVRMQQRKPVAQLKIRSLISGKVSNYTAHSNDSFEEAGIEKVQAEFIYSKRGEFWFKNPEDPSDRFMIAENIIGSAKNYLKSELNVYILKFGDRIINIELPIKIDLEVTEAPPNIKGSTADGGTKTVKTETGLEVKTPLFIERGDIIRVNTEKGEYTERAEKK